MVSRTRHKVDVESSTENQLAVFNETYAQFNSTIARLNESYASLQERHQKLADELSATNEKLRQSLEENLRVKSLAALGEVAAVIAHEVRNPLSGIAGFAALLKKELGEDHPDANYVDKIIVGVDKLNRSLTSLLEYARDLNHDPKPGNLNDLLQETVDFFRVDLNTRRSSSRIELSLPDAGVSCHFDRHNLSGALINLLKNADEAMPKSGTIKVALEQQEDGAVISVHDQGSSVPEELQEKIFTPFFTTREGGTGLGLALVRKVVDAHRGKIEIANNPDGGARFTITLPNNSQVS